LAAEIALAPGANRIPKFLKRGIAVLDENNQYPRQITELAGAVGTTFLLDGNRKRARRLFQQSMADPTGNSLAQAEWVSQAYGEIVVKERQLKTSPDATEAMARHMYRTGDFNQSLAFATRWIEEEPFNNNAYVTAAAVTNILEKYEAADKLARDGLLHDPRSLSLISNRVFSLSCLGKLNEAEDLLRGYLVKADSELMTLVGEADQGLIAFRRGNLSQGEAHYRKAIAGFGRLNAMEPKRLAEAYFAREAVRAGFEDAAKLISEFEKKNVAPVVHTAKRVLDSARAMLEPLAVA
jgi:tetratricopeptide (TPR) repeat protein